VSFELPENLAGKKDMLSQAELQDFSLAFIFPLIPDRASGTPLPSGFF